MTVPDLLDAADEAILESLNSIAGSSAVTDGIIVALMMLGASYIIALSVLPVLAKRGARLAFDLVVVIALCLAIEGLLKLSVDRARPLTELTGLQTAHFSDIWMATGPSFPSGHATRAFGVAVLIALSSRRAVGTLSLVLAAAIALSRVCLGLHWPTDVFLGALMGTAAALSVHHIQGTSRRYVRLREWAITQVRARLCSQGNVIQRRPE